MLVAVVLAAVLGLAVGALADRAARRFPWRERQVRAPGGAGAAGVVGVALGTAALFGLTAWRFWPGWELPAFLALAGAGVLLALIDLRHRLLPDRVVLPALGGGAALLALAAAVEGPWAALGRAGLGAVVLFAVFLVLALISPRSLGMGDVKLAGLLGLYLGWLGWPVLVVGAAAGFVVQALAALVLLALRRVGWRGELPFGPAMLLGAALTIGATPVLWP